MQETLYLKPEVREAWIHKHSFVMDALMKLYLAKVEQMPYLRMNLKTESYTDHKMIQVGLGEVRADSEEMLAVWAEYLLKHECQHVLSTTQKAWDTAQEEGFHIICEYLTKVLEPKPRVFRKDSDYDRFLKDMAAKGYVFSKAQIIKIVHHVVNAIEDGRIERIMCQKMPGMLHYVRICRGILWDCEPVEKEMEQNLDQPRIYLSVLLNQVLTVATTGIYQKGYVDLCGKDPYIHKKMSLMLPHIQKAVRSASCRACMEESLEVIRILAEDIAKAVKLNDLEKALSKLIKQMIEQGEFTANSKNEETMEDNGSGIAVLISVKNDPNSENDSNEDKADQKKSEDESENGTGKSSEEENTKSGPGNEPEKEDPSKQGQDTGMNTEDPSDGEKNSDENEKGTGNSSGEDTSSGEEGSGDDDSSESQDQKENGSDNKNKSEEQSSKQGDPANSKDSGENSKEGDSDKEKDNKEDMSDAIEDSLNEIRPNLDMMEEASEFAINSSPKIDVEKTEEDKLPDLSDLEEKYKDMQVEFHEETGFMKADETLPFDLKGECNTLKNKFQRLFHNQVAPVVRGQTKGKVDGAYIYRLAIKKTDVFCKKEKADPFNGCAMVIADGSGSMSSGTKWENAQRALAKIEHAVQDLMPLKIIVFNTKRGVCHSVIKNWSEKYPRNASYNFFQKHYPSSGNMDGYSIRVATRELLARPEMQKILFVISDGLPAYYDGEQDTQEAVAEARANGIEVVSILMGDNLNDTCSEVQTFRWMYNDKCCIISEPQNLSEHLVRYFKRFFNS